MGEQRRRAQSKSPARQRGGNIGNGNARKHVDLEEFEREHGGRSFSGVEPQSLLSGLHIGRRFRVLGDAVRHAMIGGGRKAGDKSISGFQPTATPLGTPHLQLKSNLKKNSIAASHQPNVLNTSDLRTPINFPAPSAS